METFKLKHGAKRPCGFRQLYRVRICSLRSTLTKTDKAAGEVHRKGRVACFYRTSSERNSVRSNPL